MSIRYIKILFINLLMIITNGCKSQEKSFDKEDKNIQLNKLLVGKNVANINVREKYLSISKSGNSYDFMSLRDVIGGLNAKISDSLDLNYIEYQRSLIDNIIKSSQKSSVIINNNSYNDGFNGWVSLTKNKSYHKEVVLYESYSFFYITQFLYILKENGWVHQSKTNKDWWIETLQFIEKNEWEKWFERSNQAKHKYYWAFLRGRTHMGSHWAGVALYLSKMTTDPQIKRQCEKLQKDYDLLLKRNFKPNPYFPSAYVWNSTYDNTQGTDATETKLGIIQDVSHGNHVVSYIVAAYELGDKDWTKEDIYSLCNTFKLVIYNKDANTFADNVDGSADLNRPGWGNFIADGWSKLSRYDKDIQEIFLKTLDKKEIKKYNSGIQLKANLFNSKL